jgi:iron complex transport system ATP-binding protein
VELTDLRIENISYTCSQQSILSRINFDIPLGELVGLIGPNGAGKSTLLRIIDGLLTPKCGQVLFNGHNVLHIPEKKRARLIAMVPQDPWVGFGFTVKEVVAMGRYPYANRFSPLSSDCLKTIDDVLNLTGTSHLAHRLITRISGGEKQRVFIARALAQEPSVLLLDEPTANLDIKYQLEILDLVKSLQQTKGLSVIMAIHDLHLASRYCSYLLVLKEGCLVSSGPTEEVLTENIIEDVFQVKAHFIEVPPYKYLRVDPRY